MRKSLQGMLWMFTGKLGRFDRIAITQRPQRFTKYHKELFMEEDIIQSLDTLEAGGTILYPTDTIWGIGCDATNEDAVKKLYKIKRRENSQSLLILLDDPMKLGNYVKAVPDIAWEIINVTNKPLTLIYPEGINLAKNVLANDGSVGIRITNDEFCVRLIRRFHKPIVSTSANYSGQSPPANFSEIAEELVNKMDYVVKWRQKEKRKGSSSGIIKVGVNNEIEVIRE